MVLKVGISFAFLCATINTDSAAEKIVENTAMAKLSTTMDSVSYVIGYEIGNSLNNIKDEVVLDVIVAGIKDKLAGKPPCMTPSQESSLMHAFNAKMGEKEIAKSEPEAKKNLAEAKKFLEENGKKKGVITAKSGLQYLVLKQGNGTVPADTSQVKVHYEGRLLDGKVFDSSIKRGQPAVFGVNQVIPGWTEALKLMKAGSKYKLFLHPDLAYGRRGMLPDIGPNSLLLFDVELLGIEPPVALPK